MSNQSLSLNLPEPLFSRLEARARNSNRSIEAETVDVLTTAVSDSVDGDAIEQSLSVLDDQALRNAAQSHLAANAAEQMEELHIKARRCGLTELEMQTLAELIRQYERAMLVRSCAAVLLKDRGRDISQLERVS